MRAQDQEPVARSRSRRPQANSTGPVPVHPDAPLTDEAILHLQRTVGNGAVAHLIEARRQSRSSDPVVQRVVYGTDAEQRAQHEQLDNLPAMWVPVEQFDQDGNSGQPPTVAYAGQRNGFGMDAVRVGRRFNLPSLTATRSGIPLVESWEVEYQTSFFVYRVEAINDPQRLSSRTLIDPEQPFTVVRVTPKGSQGRSMGRTYRFGDFWDINPNFLANFGTNQNAAMRELIHGRGLQEENRVRPQDLGSLVQLPSDPYQPFLFYTRNVIDPNFTDQHGARKDNRRFMLPAGFDALAGQARAAGQTRGQVGLSMPPVANRQDAGRDPATAMGGFSAHNLMPTSGRGGAMGRLASHEWCHLIGDNDGGPTEFRNLVIGTNAVNTEQLAMESALRDFRPRMDGLGYAIRLRVEAIVERAEAESPVIPGGPHLKADWISFTIDIVDKRPSAGPVATRPQVVLVYRQIMDANRGTITESEFTSLHHQVRNLLRTEHARLRDQRRQAELAQQGSAMAID